MAISVRYVCNGAEGLVLLVGEDEGELALVHAIHVDLLMVESG